MGRIAGKYRPEAEAIMGAPVIMALDTEVAAAE
jgi:hypothetical protein